MMKEDKIVSIEERIPKLKEKRRKKANRKLLFYLTLFFFLIVMIIYLQSPFSKVEQIDVQGNEAISDEQIIEYSNLSINENIWRINVNEVEKNILSHPIVKDIHVERKFPQTIKVTVVEEKIIGYIKEDKQYYPIIDDGVVIATTDIDLPRGAPLFENFDEEHYVKRLAEELSNIPTDILNLISEIHWKPTKNNQYKIELYMNDGFIVYATIRDFASKMNSYPSIIAQLEPGEKGIIHMDVGIYVETFKK